MSDVLILGANGQLGSDLIKIFIANQVNHIGVTRKEFDVSNDDIENLKKYKAKYIINCVATTDVDGAEINSELAFSVNSNFVYKLAKFCQENAIILFHISTDYVFDGTNTLKYSEDYRPNPLNIYGLSKYTGELALQNYHDKFFIFRVSSLFGISGASGKGGNFVTTMRKLGVTRDSISVIADQITCPTSTLDIARAICNFVLTGITDYGIYNCVSSNSCSWYEFTREIFRLSEIDVDKVTKTSFNEYSFIAKRPQYGMLDISKLSKYYKMPTWQDALHEYITLLK